MYRDWRVSVLGLLAAVVLACDRRFEPWVEPEAEPPAAERPVRIPGLASPSPATRPAPSPTSSPRPSSPPLPAPSATSSSLSADGMRISGTLRVASGAEVPAGGVLYVIARAPSGGPPLAVRRLDPGPFPLAFELGPGDAMIPGRPLAGSVVISARVDPDGDPLTREPGGLSATLDDPVGRGTRDVVLGLEPETAD